MVPRVASAARWSPLIVFVFLKRARRALNTDSANAGVRELWASPEGNLRLNKAGGARNAGDAVVFLLNEDGAVRKRQTLAANVTSMVTLYERARRIVGVPGSVTEVAKNILVLDVRLVGAWSEHCNLPVGAENPACAST